MVSLHVVLASLFCAQLGDELYHDFRKGPIDRPWAVPWGAHASEYMRMDLGLRVTLPEDRRPLSPVGLMVKARLMGDFEVTGGFAIVDVPEPAKKPGAGVSMYYQMDTDPGVHGSIAWLNTPVVGTRFSAESVWERPGGKRRTTWQGAPTAARSGRLQLRREGDRLHFLASHGLDEPLVEFHNAVVGTHDIRSVRFNGTTIEQATPCDVRLLDLRVRATRVDSEFSTAEPKLPAAEPPPKRVSLIILATCLSLAAVGAIVLWLLRGKKTARPKPSSVVEGTSEPPA